MSKIQILQNLMNTEDIEAFLVPYSDEHQGEYLLPASKRLEWLFGFTGSAGLGIVTQNKAALFVDGRYTLQAPQEVEGLNVEVLNFTKEAIYKWLEGIKSLSFDARLHTIGEIEGYQKEEFVLNPVHNPVDKLWENQPSNPQGLITNHALSFAGEDLETKLKKVFLSLENKACVLNALDSIAWLLNIRGNDTPNTPLAQGFVILQEEKAHFYVELGKINNLTLPSCIVVHALHEFEAGLKAISQPVLLDKSCSTVFIEKSIQSEITFGRDPVVDLRSVKNATEIEGAKQAHLQDGLAMAKFLYWFDETQVKDELEVMAKLEAFRAENALYKGASFNTIAGAGSNAAIVHYRSSEKTNRLVPNNSLFLLDSGGQYEAGTTDITRTIAVGKVSKQHKKHYTLVLKGMLALSRAQFPKGTHGAALDTLARQFLWQEGLNYGHGTGHGVGSYLGVHEGVARISPLGAEPLKAGMILSNEPGYYEAGSHGIRIENLLLVVEAQNGFLEFETLTLCPIDTRPILKQLLTKEEVKQLNSYHARVYKKLKTKTKSAEDWLKKATKPI